MTWQIVYTKQAKKDARKLAASALKKNAQELLMILETDPFQTPPPYEKLVGDLSGAYSLKCKRKEFDMSLLHDMFSNCEYEKRRLEYVINPFIARMRITRTNADTLSR